MMHHWNHPIRSCTRRASRKLSGIWHPIALAEFKLGIHTKEDRRDTEGIA